MGSRSISEVGTKGGVTKRVGLGAVVRGALILSVNVTLQLIM